MLKRFGLLGQRQGCRPLHALSVLMIVFVSVGGAASDFMPADCDAALNNQQAALGDFIFA